MSENEVERKTFEFDHSSGFGFQPIENEPEPIVEETTPVETTTTVIESGAEVEPVVEEVTAPEVVVEEVVEVDDESPIEEISVETEPVESETPTEEVVESETDNFFEFAAAKMKASGDLPDDFEFDATDEGASDVIFDKYKEVMGEDITKEYQQQFKSYIDQKGWNDETMELASMLQHGVKYNDLAQAIDYDKLSSTNTDNFTDEEHADFAKRMYQDRGLKTKEIERMISTAELDGELELISKESVEYFTNRKEEKDQLHKEEAQQNSQLRQQQEQYRQQIVQHVLTNGEIAGENLSEGMLEVFEEAILDKNVPVRLDNGVVHNVTQFDQFQYSLGNDYGLQLWAFKKFLFRDQEAQEMLQKAETEADKRSSIKWSQKAKRVQPVKSDKSGGDEAKSAGDYMYENGSFKPIE